MRKIFIAILLASAASRLFAGTYNNLSIQGQLSQTTPIDGVKVHVLTDGQVVGTASDISLIPDAQGMFSTQTYITNPWVFRSGSEYLLRLSSSTGEVLSTFTITAAPFALTVRGDSSTGDQNTFSAYGNIGIGTDVPDYRLVVSSGGTNLMWVASDGLHATKFTGDGSSLTNIGVGSTATQDLDMAGYKITNAGDISGTRYQIAGSTVLAVLPGGWSLGVGIGAGRLNTGFENTFIGTFSGEANTTGQLNAFLGARSGYRNTTGESNAFMGTESGYSNQTGSYNAFLGGNSGVDNLDGSLNVFTGMMSGWNNTSGSNNTFVGFNAGDGNLVGSYNIAIGQDTQLDSSGNYQLNIGNLIYGDLAAKSIGISTRIPQAALDVVSTGTASNVYAQIWRNGSGVVVASMTSQGTLYATLPASGDNLGNHTATQALNMSGNQILNVSSLTITGKDISGYSLSLSSGINMPAGTVKAERFLGDGSRLSGIVGDNLGNHTAAQALNMGGNQILNISSLTVTGKDPGGYSLKLSSGINMPDGTVTAGLFVGNGSGLTGLPSSGDVYKSSTQTFTGANTFTNSVVVNSVIFPAGEQTYPFKAFTSAEQTITSGGTLTIAHGLGTAPRFLSTWLVCKTANNGWSVGDVYYVLGSLSHSTTDNRGHAISADATNIYVKFGSYAYVYGLLSKSTGGGFDSVNSNWRLVLQAAK